MIGPIVSQLRAMRANRLLPQQDQREIALHYVIGVLCLLACGAALVVMASDRAAHGWTRDIRSEVTVQVRPTGLESGSVAAAKAAEVLAGVKGVGQVTAIEPEKAKALIKPWLGDTVLDDLPIPNLVEVSLDPQAPATPQALMNALTARDIDASIDDHSTWLKDVEQTAMTWRLISLGIFFILFSAAGSVVGFATRAGLTARADIVDVLALCGASDTFIAERFQWRFARMSFESGLLGAALAAGAMAFVKTTASAQSFAIALPFSWYDLLILIPCPFLVALIGALTARMVTLRLLSSHD